MVKELPRRFDQTQVIQVVLKRAKQHKTWYKAETICPAQVCEALSYLKDQKLYKKNGSISINEKYFEKYNKNKTANIDFVLDDEIAGATYHNKSAEDMQKGDMKTQTMTETRIK